MDKTNFVALHDSTHPDRREIFRVTSDGEVILGPMWDKDRATHTFWDSFIFEGKSLVQQRDEALARAEATEAALQQARLQYAEDEDADNRIADR
jgi:hypothetical protein